jgi:hypothetical protein
MNTPQTDTHFIDEFCTKHGACREGYLWATEHCTSMQEVWEKAKPEWLIWVATRKGVLTDSELRRFAVWSARRVQHLMTDPRSLDALDVAERHAEGSATDEELAAARAAAFNAAHATAFNAAHAVARAAAHAAAWNAAYAAACAAACAAAFDAACDAQAEWLRKHTTPNFN